MDKVMKQKRKNKIQVQASVIEEQEKTLDIVRINDVSIKISEREVQVMLELAKGNTAYKTAKHLGIEENTIRAHIANITKKVNAKNKLHALVLLLKNNIIKLEEL